MAPRVTNDGDLNDLLLSGNVMECMFIGLEHSIDLLSCDAANARNDCDADVNPPAPISAIDLTALNYPKLHDEFIESLLQERQLAKGSVDEVSGSCQVLPLIRTISSDSTTSSPRTDLTPPPIGVITTTSTPRKRRVVKVSRRSPRRTSRTQITPLPQQPAYTGLSSRKSCAMDDSFSLKSDSSLVTHVTNRLLADPESFVHDQCKLQKDKNKGDVVGSDICAVGKDECLRKIRQKMELLTQVALGKSDSEKSVTSQSNKKASASMKRRKAKVSEETTSYTETRSVIDLRMGFLSMKYGILLRWDRLETGKILMVVLRKMCAESFYKKECLRKIEVNQEKSSSPCFWTDNHAIWAQREATEVSLLEPPHRIVPSEAMRPVVLSMNLLRLDDFDTRSTWTLLFTINGQVQQITHRSSRHRMDQCLNWELPPKSVELDLEITAIEQKRARNKRQRAKQIHPLHLLADGEGDKLSILMPCGTLHLEIRHNSDYCRWLRRELEARGRDPDVAIPIAFTDHSIESDDSDKLEWNCCGLW